MSVPGKEKGRLNRTMVFVVRLFIAPLSLFAVHVSNARQHGALPPAFPDVPPSPAICVCFWHFTDCDFWTAMSAIEWSQELKFHLQAKAHLKVRHMVAAEQRDTDYVFALVALRQVTSTASGHHSSAPATKTPVKPKLSVTTIADRINKKGRGRTAFVNNMMAITSICSTHEEWTALGVERDVEDKRKCEEYRRIDEKLNEMRQVERKKEIIEQGGADGRHNILLAWGERALPRAAAP